jgi:hypothetical protein
MLVRSPTNLYLMKPSPQGIILPFSICKSNVRGRFHPSTSQVISGDVVILCTLMSFIFKSDPSGGLDSSFFQSQARIFASTGSSNVMSTVHSKILLMDFLTDAAVNSGV